MKIVPNFMRSKVGGMSMKIVKRINVWEWGCLVWKMFPDPVGVFCTLLEPPNYHIVQKFIAFSVKFKLFLKYHNGRLGG